MIVSPATALATAVPIDRQGVAPPHVGPSVPVLETWSVMDRAVAGIASAIARTATSVVLTTRGPMSFMSSLLYRPALLIALAGSVFALAAFFTRATPRRMAGALAGGFGFGLLNLAWDVVAYHMRWWWYPAPTPRSFGPWYWYAAA